MFQLTQAAAAQVIKTRQRQGYPNTLGARVFGEPEPTGRVALKLAFTEVPAEDDQVSEQAGTRVFVAPEVADVLASSALDIEPTADGPRLVLTEQEHDGH